MKKLFKIFVVFTMVISLSSCELWLEKIFSEFLDEIEQEYEDENQNSGDEDENNSDDDDNTNENSGNEENQNSGGNQNVVLNGAVNITSGRYPMAEGSQAEKWWNADEAEYVYAFDADGKCTLNGSRYYLKDVSYYEKSKKELEDWKPIWSDDHASFIIDIGMHDYTTYDDAIKKIEEHFLSYTIKDSSGTRTVAAPTEEEKVQKMREVFGFTFDDLGSDYADYHYTTVRGLNSVTVYYHDDATIDEINALTSTAFELCKPLAENGKMYTLMGKYGETITSAPEATESLVIDSEFCYFYKDKEIHVKTEIFDSWGNRTLRMYVFVYK